MFRILPPAEFCNRESKVRKAQARVDENTDDESDQVEVEGFSFSRAFRNCKQLLIFNTIESELHQVMNKIMKERYYEYI